MSPQSTAQTALSRKSAAITIEVRKGKEKQEVSRKYFNSAGGESTNTNTASFLFFFPAPIPAMADYMGETAPGAESAVEVAITG